MESLSAWCRRHRRWKPKLLLNACSTSGIPRKPPMRPGKRAHELRLRCGATFKRRWRRTSTCSVDGGRHYRRRAAHRGNVRDVMVPALTALRHQHTADTLDAACGRPKNHRQRKRICYRPTAATRRVTAPPARSGTKAATPQRARGALSWWTTTVQRRRAVPYERRSVRRSAKQKLKSIERGEASG